MVFSVFNKQKFLTYILIHESFTTKYNNVDARE